MSSSSASVFASFSTGSCSVSSQTLQPESDDFWEQGTCVGAPVPLQVLFSQMGPSGRQRSVNKMKTLIPAVLEGRGPRLLVQSPHRRLHSPQRAQRDPNERETNDLCRMGEPHETRLRSPHDVLHSHPVR